MNTALLTGWLIKPAAICYTPTGQSKLAFEVGVKSDDGQVTPWHCEIALPELILKAEPYATAGRPVIIQAHLAGRPFVQAGITKGYTRFLQVTAIEFPNRAKQAEATEDEGQTET